MRALSLICLFTSACLTEAESTIDTGAETGAPETCTLDAELEAALLANATGLMEDATFVGGVTESSQLEFVYAMSLFGQVASAGWMIFTGCEGGPSAFDPTCANVAGLDGAWSCVQPVCVDEQTLRIETWYAEDGISDPEAGGSFSLPFEDTGGTLRFDGAPLHTWTMAVEQGYTEVAAAHEVTVAHTSTDGVESDLSHTVVGDIVHGAEHPAFELVITYPAIEAGHTWVMTLDFDEDGLEGQLLRDGEPRAQVLDATPEDEHHLVLAMAWETCETETRRPPEIREPECPPTARADCPPTSY